MLCLDVWSGWVLSAVKDPSENERELRPAIERSVAIMRDLGSAEAKVVARYRHQATPDLVCHNHFRAAVAMKLLVVDYGVLSARLRRSQASSGLRELLRKMRRSGPGADRPPGPGSPRDDLPALLLWALEGERRKHLSHLVVLPHWDFYRCCGQFRNQAQRQLRSPTAPTTQPSTPSPPPSISCAGAWGARSWGAI